MKATKYSRHLVKEKDTVFRSQQHTLGKNKLGFILPVICYLPSLCRSVIKVEQEGYPFSFNILRCKSGNLETKLTIKPPDELFDRVHFFILLKMPLTGLTNYLRS